MTTKKTKQPAKELIEKELNHHAEREVMDFAGHLEVARALWRSHRELVEAPRMPARLKAAVLKADGGRVFTSMHYGCPDLAEAREWLMSDPFWSKSIMDHAREETAKATTTRQAEPVDLPDWVASTPDVSLQLAVFVDGDQDELIELTRREYIDLKEHLATLRGYVLPKAA